jgi:hypothetical protein
MPQGQHSASTADQILPANVNALRTMPEADGFFEFF